MNSIPAHAPKPSGRVGFESGDFAEPRNGFMQARRYSDVSVNDILMKQRTIRMDDFLNTR